MPAPPLALELLVEQEQLGWVLVLLVLVLVLLVLGQELRWALPAPLGLVRQVLRDPAMVLQVQRVRVQAP